MKNKQLKYIGILLIVVVLWLLKSFYNPAFKNHSNTYSRQTYPTENTRNTTPVAKSNATEDNLNRHSNRILYSRHARCRMDCRHIDEAEVKDILLHGKVNQRKIETDSRGKTYPLEGVSEGHHLRIVFAPKGNDVVEVVTCIDLDTEWQCDCH
jgi:hypothetical protein